MKKYLFLLSLLILPLVVAVDEFSHKECDYGMCVTATIQGQTYRDSNGCYVEFKCRYALEGIPSSTKRKLYFDTTTCSATSCGGGSYKGSGVSGKRYYYEDGDTVEAVCLYYAKDSDSYGDSAFVYSYQSMSYSDLSCFGGVVSTEYPIVFDGGYFYPDCSLGDHCYGSIYMQDCEGTYMQGQMMAGYNKQYVNDIRCGGEIDYSLTNQEEGIIFLWDNEKPEVYEEDTVTIIDNLNLSVEDSGFDPFEWLSALWQEILDLLIGSSSTAVMMSVSEEPNSYYGGSSK